MIKGDDDPQPAPFDKEEEEVCTSIAFEHERAVLALRGVTLDYVEHVLSEPDTEQVKRPPANESLAALLCDYMLPMSDAVVHMVSLRLGVAYNHPGVVWHVYIAPFIDESGDLRCLTRPFSASRALLLLLMARVRATPALRAIVKRFASREPSFQYAAQFFDALKDDPFITWLNKLGPPPPRDEEPKRKKASAVQRTK